MTRARPRAALALLLAIAAGLLSRRWPLPGPLAEYTGDALWATAARLLGACLWPRARGATLTAFAFALAAAVECSQLLHTNWLDELRATTPGHLLLGQGLHWPDFVAYAAGALLGWPVDRALTSPGTRSGPAAGASPPAPA